MLHLDQVPLNSNDVKTILWKEVLHQFNTTPVTENETTYAKLERSVKAAAAVTLSKKSKPSPGWFLAAKDIPQPLIDERNNVLPCLFSKRTRANTMRIQKARKQLKAEITRAKNNWILSQCRNLNETSSDRGGTKQSWNTVCQYAA